MPYIQSSKSSLNPPVQIYYEDTGNGKPVIFIHGWPLDSRMWEYQRNELPQRGFRCITYDRRGFGKSDRPWDGYDYDTLATDLKSVIDELNLSRVTLVGFSMGGGEIARYIGKFGSEKIEKVVLIGSVTPFLLKTDDNPDGLPQEQFDEFESQIREDRPAFMTTFGKMFYGVGLLSKPVSTAFLDWNQSVVMEGSPQATLQCLRAFSSTDFRHDLLKFDVPTLVVHGDSDKTVPIDISAKKAVGLIPGALFKIYAGEPHGLFYTQKDSLNQNLVDFILHDRMSDADLDSEAVDATSERPVTMPNTGLV